MIGNLIRPERAWGGPGVRGFLAGVSPEDFVLGRDGDYAGIFCFSKPDASDDELAISE